MWNSYVNYQCIMMSPAAPLPPGPARAVFWWSEQSERSLSWLFARKERKKEEEGRRLGKGKNKTWPIGTYVSLVLIDFFFFNKRQNYHLIPIKGLKKPIMPLFYIRGFTFYPP